MSFVYLSPRVLPLLALGFASGLPLALISGTLQAWMTDSFLSLRQLGLLTLAGSAYTLKFLWAPLLDRFSLPFLGRRRGWMLLSQLLLAVSLVLMGMLSPVDQFHWIFMLAVWIAFLSASQDIVFDAYSTDVLQTEERAAGAAIRVTGYRLGMIVSGGLAMILASSVGWSVTYALMGLLMALAALVTILAPEPQDQVVPPKTIRAAVREPFIDFFSRRGAIGLLLLIVLYKLGDAFASALSTTFLLRGAGFTLAEVGYINKVFGLLSTIGGALLGGALMVRLGLYKSLMFFGILQAVSNLGYWYLAVQPQPDVMLMAFVICVENICGGLGTAAFIALIMALCNRTYSASQFALLSAISAVGRTYLAGPISALLVESFGWPTFFICSLLFALPGLFMLWRYRSIISELDQPMRG